MDSDYSNNSVEVVKLIPWKNPLIYILLILSVIIYWFVIRPMEYRITPNIIERSVYTKLFVLFVILTVMLALFFKIRPYFAGKNLLIKTVVFFTGFLLFAFFLIPLWGYYKYDNEKIVSYVALIPSKTRFIRVKKIVYYTEIKSVEYESGGDSGNSLNFNLSDGEQMGLPVDNISYNALQLFLNTLYDNCQWLQQDIEKRYGSVINHTFAPRMQKKFALNPDGIYLFFSTIAIWLTILEFIFFMKKLFDK